MKCFLWINLVRQCLYYCRKDNGIILREFPVSTAKNGPGEQVNSGCTPRGWHVIRAKIGAGAPLMAVFAGRRPTGEIYSATLGKQYPERDWILTRILWLSGLERGRNRMGNVDTFRRYIYMHGSPDNLIRGIPESHGCIRMRNEDIAWVFDAVDHGTKVYVSEEDQFPPSLP